MARDLKQILSELGGHNAKALYGDSLRMALKGDWKAVVDVADCLREDSLSLRNLSLAKELYEWLVESDHKEYLPYICEVDHLLAPELAYTERDVRLFLDYCGQCGTHVFGLLVQALLSDTQLFHRFKNQTIQTYKYLAK